MMAGARIPFNGRYRACIRGVAAVELGLLLTLLTTLSFGVGELGRAFYQYDALTKSVRTAARYLTQFGAGDATAIANAKCLALYGNTGCTGDLLAPGLTAAMVTVCDSSNCAGTHAKQGTGRGIVNLVTVSVVGYSFTPVVTLVVTQPINFSTISATMAQLVP